MLPARHDDQPLERRCTLPDAYSSRGDVPIYTRSREAALDDFSHNIPWKRKHPEDLPQGWYGFTFLGSNHMWVNSSLVPGSERAYETDVHESIHTPDEYETRVIVDAILHGRKRIVPYERGPAPYLR